MSVHATTEVLTSRERRLDGKVALVFGAGGSVGAAVAREFALEGANVFLSGQTAPTIEAVARQIRDDGGLAQVARVDAESEAEVAPYIDGIVQQEGRIDVVFNAIGPRAGDYGTGASPLDLPVDAFTLPLQTLVRSQFVTARAAARHMVKQQSGVIIFLTGGPALAHAPGATAIGTAFGAIESLMRNLAMDLSPLGVRVVCVRSVAMIDSRTINEILDRGAGTGTPREAGVEFLRNLTLLKRSPTTVDTARAAAFLASDAARMLTGTILNSSAGAHVD
jgi:NAD(P)-dependent dehydrogenase (short-subunit alcohol dehydrogenase family)